MLVTSRKSGQSLLLRHRQSDPAFQVAHILLGDLDSDGNLTLFISLGPVWIAATLPRFRSMVLKLGPNTYADIGYRGHNGGMQHRLKIQTEDCIEISRLPVKETAVAS